jgi:cytochrome P450
VTEDHTYDGYFIPKGTVVFGNSWGLMHDPDVFPNPMEFKPERFLTKEGKINPEVPEPMALFGYGRRCVVCQLCFPTLAAD